MMNRTIVHYRSNRRTEAFAGLDEAEGLLLPILGHEDPQMQQPGDYRRRMSAVANNGS